MECTLWQVSLWVVGLYIVYRLLDYIVRIPRVGSLSERRIFVTGCDTGFGNEIAKRLDRLGCQVFAACLTEKGETDLKKCCSSKLKTVHMNVADPKSVRRAFDKVNEQIPDGQGLWGLMNNAGISGKLGPVEWLKLDDYRQVFDVNLLGLIDTTVTFLPLLKKARGRIVNVASILGRYSLAGNTPYCISTYGVECFSDAIRRQLYDYGTTVHLIEPGFYKTNITDVDSSSRQVRAAWAQASPEIQREYGEEYLEKSVQILVKKFLEEIVSENIHEVVDAYEHALIGLFPRARYVVGKDAKFLWLPMSRLPEWLGDLLFRKLSKDNPKPAAVLKM